MAKTHTKLTSYKKTCLLAALLFFVSIFVFPNCSYAIVADDGKIEVVNTETGEITLADPNNIPSGSVDYDQWRDEQRATTSSDATTGAQDSAGETKREAKDATKTDPVSEPLEEDDVLSDLPDMSGEDSAASASGGSGAKVPDCPDNVPCVKLLEPMAPGIENIQDPEGKGGLTFLQIYASVLYKWMAGILGFVAVLVLVASGIQIMASGANPSGITSAKERIEHTIIGLVLLFLTSLLLYTVNPTFFTAGSGSSGTAAGASVLDATGLGKMFSGSLLSDSEGQDEASNTGETAGNGASEQEDIDSAASSSNESENDSESSEEEDGDDAESSAKEGDGTGQSTDQGRAIGETPQELIPNGGGNLSTLPRGMLADKIVPAIIKIIISIGGVFAFLSILYSASVMMLLGDNEEQIKKAQTNLVYSIVGLVVMGFAYTIVSGILLLPFS